MCRANDFPPYPKAVAYTNVTQDDWVMADPDLVAQPTGIFRTLSSTEERAFREWARANWQAGQYINPLWHPVVRDECALMDAEASERQGTR